MSDADNRLREATRRAEHWFYNYLAGDWTGPTALAALVTEFHETLCPHSQQHGGLVCPECHAEPSGR
jgi:hypothetical protein